jgi:hypothetical protein
LALKGLAAIHSDLRINLPRCEASRFFNAEKNKGGSAP